MAPERATHPLVESGTGSPSLPGAKPLVSVIMPVHNGAAFVAGALASIGRQTHSPLEIIVVDDGSTDASPRIIEGFRQERWPGLQYHRQPKAGPAAARNRGLELASGELIAFLDADDQWARGSLAGSVEMLADPALQVVVGCTQPVRAESGGGADSALEAFGPTWMTFLLGAAVFRRDVFSFVGPFDESLRYGEDVDWFLRAREAGVNIGIRPDVTLLYRRHEGNMTLDKERSNHYFLEALHKSLRRRRSRDGEASDLAGIAALSGKTLADFQAPPEREK